MIKCSIPCIYVHGIGLFSSSWYSAHIVSDKSTNLRLAMQLDMPGKLTDGQQVEMEFRSQNDNEVKIDSVKLILRH